MSATPRGGLLFRARDALPNSLMRLVTLSDASFGCAPEVGGPAPAVAGPRGGAVTRTRAAAPSGSSGGPYRLVDQAGDVAGRGDGDRVGGVDGHDRGLRAFGR